MKKPARPLRSASLDNTALAKATGGRGTCHGYYECNFCHWQSPSSWSECESCGRPWDRLYEGMGGPGSKK